MVEILTGLVLALAAGLNAYIPLLGIGLLAKFTNLITLPENWEWLTSDPMLIIVAVLLLIELFVDKVPLLDSVNDILQTLMRPAAGGMVFAAGLGSETVSVQNPDAFADSNVWGPIAIGVIIALIPHLLKMIGRPVINAVTGGAAAPVMSTIEDTGAVGLTIFAIIFPILGLVLVVVLFFIISRRIKKARASKETRAV